jgi:hypothetical protein
MNALYVELEEGGSGDANGLVGIVLWLAVFSGLLWVSEKLSLSVRVTRALWGACNFGPLAAWLVAVPTLEVLPVIGVGAVVAFSYWMGAEAINDKDREL